MCSCSSTTSEEMLSNILYILGVGGGVGKLIYRRQEGGFWDVYRNACCLKKNPLFT
jgi:hypothetical protein